MTQGRVPLYVRLPSEQAAALDRLAQETGRHKQQVVSELLGDRLEIGHLQLRERPAAEADDVLTLAEVAELLRVPPAAVIEVAEAGELPGRRLGAEWRFTRRAVLDWLGGVRGDGAGDGER